MEDDTQEKGPSLNPMYFLSKYEKLSLVKQVASLDLFGSSGIIRVIIDMEKIVPVPFIGLTLLI